jgi:hypothetical protein
MATPFYTGFDYGQGLSYLNKGIGSIADAFKEKRATDALLSAFDQSQQGMQQPQQAAPLSLANLTQQPPQMPAPAAPIPGNGAFPASLIQTESGGNWQAKNDVMGSGGKAGHFGRLQFGQARLEDAARAGAIPQGVTPQQFMADPELQKRAESWHFSDIDSYIKQNGLDRAVGANINGVPVTLDGMRAVAHLGGKEGLQKFIATGGKYNPADVNGTSLMSYMQQHGGRQQGNPMAGMQPPQSQQPPVQVAQMGGGTPAAPASRGGLTPDIVRGLLANPATRSMGQAAWQQMLNPKADYGFQVVGDQVYRTNSRTGQIEPVGVAKSMNPLDQQAKELANQKAVLELEQMRAGGALPQDVRAYEYARNNGFAGSFIDYQRELSKARTQQPDIVGQVEARRAAAEAAGIKPDSPGYQTYLATGKMPREDQQPLSATDKKAILEADEGVAAAQSSISALQQAKVLSKKAYEGPTAGPRGSASALFGSEAGVATTELDNLITSNALSQLKGIFGAAPTEGERKILMEIQGSVSQPDAVRQRVYDRAIQMAARRLEFNKQRAGELRGGTFYRPGSGAQQQGQTQQQQMPMVQQQEAAKPAASSIAEGATATNPTTGQKIRFTGGKWVPVQ